MKAGNVRSVRSRKTRRGGSTGKHIRQRFRTGFCSTYGTSSEKRIQKRFLQPGLPREHPDDEKAVRGESGTKSGSVAQNRSTNMHCSPIVERMATVEQRLFKRFLCLKDRKAGHYRTGNSMQRIRNQIRVSFAATWQSYATTDKCRLLLTCKTDLFVCPSGFSQHNAAMRFREPVPFNKRNGCILNRYGYERLSMVAFETAIRQLSFNR